MIVVLLPLISKSQDLPHYSQYLLNPYLFNPSLAGIAADGIAQTTNRIQWIGIPDAPRINSISYQQAFKSTGLGGYIYSDKNGLNSELGVQLTYAYHVYFRKTRTEIVRLSLGGSICGFQHSVDESKFTDIENDPAVIGIETQYMWNINFGAGFDYNKFNTGFSVANLIPKSYKTYTGIDEPIIRRNYFLTAGYSFPISKKFSLDPSVVFKTTENLNAQIDMNLKTKYITKEHTIWLALSFRRIIERTSQQNISLMPVIGYETDFFIFAYAYDYGLSAIQAQNFGSHEIMVGYKFNKNRSDPCACPPNKKYRK